MLVFLYPQVSQLTQTYLHEEMAVSSDNAVRSKGSNWTKEEGMLNQVIFSLLKKTYLPLLILKV